MTTTARSADYCLTGDAESLTITDRHLWSASNVTRPALLAWLEVHGLDPDVIPVHAEIRRDVEGRAVVVEEYLTDRQGRRFLLGAGPSSEVATAYVRHQGETPPLPWPDLVQRALRG